MFSLIQGIASTADCMSKMKVRSIPESVYRGVVAQRALQADEIEIWQSPNELDPADYERLPHLLSADEVQRAAAFRFERHRKQYIIGRGVLRILLAGYLQIDPLAVRFQYSAKGKPELPSDQNSHMQFNIAHSGGIILLGFTSSRKIGIDVEAIRSDVEIDEISQRFFSPFERQWLAGLPLPQRCGAFFRCWTRKEALLKGTGEGLSVGLDSFNVFSNPEEDSCWLETSNDNQWLIQDVELCPDYAAAVAIEH
jgi:4'-phosphopantetheinyl transferase